MSIESTTGAEGAPVGRATRLLWWFALVWLPAGLIFRLGIKGFGWGYIPMIFWFYSFPFVGLVAGIAFFTARRGCGKHARHRARVWLLLSVVYLAATVAWHSIPQLREWVITGRWELVE